MVEMFVEIGMAVFAVLYIFGYVHDFIFWLCDRHNEKKRVRNLHTDGRAKRRLAQEIQQGA